MNTSHAEDFYKKIPSLPRAFFSASHEAIAGAAEIFGISSPLREARVLEIGCAVGGHIVPLAARYPDAYFTGIDSSASQIVEAENFKNELQLKNVEFICTSFEEFRGEPFDYVIANNLYSILTPEMQGKFFECALANLKPAGVLSMDFRVSPGEDFTRSVARMIRHHVAGIEDWDAKIDQIQAIAKFLLDNSLDHFPHYKEALEHELKLITRYDRDIFYHIHMSENFMPSTISELVSKAETHGFMYLVDTGNMDSPPFSVKSEVAEIFQEISGDVQKSQYVDFLTGRPVRQVLFCKNDLQVSRNLNPDILSRCRMLTNWLPILSEDGVDVKKLLSTKDTSVKCDFCLASRQDVKINVNSPVVSAILYALSSKGCHYPSLEELEDEVRSILGSNFIRENFLNELLPMYFNGLIGVVHKDVHQKIATSYTDKDHLRSFSPARYLAARSQIAPNICHKLISLTAMQRYILVQFDGTKDTLAILEEVDNQISSGKMTAERDGKKISGALLHEHVREQISILQRAALFEESN